jgi:predicted nucleotidyltransferase component of viral defense system
MIPAAIITGWAQKHPWISSGQVEQDLVLSRALVQIYSSPVLKEKLVFRGGTALHKLYMTPAARYSEDLDFVQISEGAIGELLDAIRFELNPWLGEPRSNVSTRGSTLVYRFESELPPIVRLRLKIEINTREHFHVHPLEQANFSIDTRWFSGATEIPVYRLSELLGTKLRALYQRRKGRDLFDLWYSHHCGLLHPESVVEVFHQYMTKEGHHVSRKEFQENIQAKLSSPAFLTDTPPLLRAGIAYTPQKAAEYIERSILPLLG